MKYIFSQTYVNASGCYAEHRGEELLISKEGKSEIVVLAGTGIDLWHMLMKKKTLNQLIEGLCKEYEVEPKTAKQDIEKFLKKMIESGIVTEV